MKEKDKGKVLFMMWGGGGALIQFFCLLKCLHQERAKIKRIMSLGNAMGLIRFSEL